MDHSVKAMEWAGKELEAQAEAYVKRTMAINITLGVLALVGGAIWIWMIVALTKLEPPGSEKIVWTIIVVLLGPIGAIIYFFSRYLELHRQQA